MKIASLAEYRKPLTDEKDSYFSDWGDAFRERRGRRLGDLKKWEHLWSSEPLAARWVPPKLRFYEPGEIGVPGGSKKRPLSTATDMPYVYGHSLLLVSARLAEQCGNVLRVFGEFLPVDCEQGQFFAYPCTNVVDCLNEQHSDLSRSETDGRILNIYKPVFRSERLTPLIVFRLPVGNPDVVFCDGEVHELMTAPPLRGVTADPVWQSS